MYKNIAEYFVLNKELKKNIDFKEFDGDKCYEVLRVIEKKPIFLDEHLHRLHYSMIKMGIETPIDDIRASVFKLIQSNQSMINNIKIDVSKNNFRVYYVESSYPSEEKYKTGIRCITSTIQRDMPTVKKLNLDYKKKIKSLLHDDIFEVLLMENDDILEGSKSNVFFILNGTIYITPEDKILKGITYNKVISIIKELNLSIKYESFNINDNMEGAFLTGTSIGVLPIHKINNITINSSSNDIINDIMKMYNNLVEEERLK